MAKAPSLHLLVAALPGGERRFRLPPGEHVLGSSPGCDVRLEDPTVSRRHLQVSLTSDGALRWEDLGSSNGTWQDGRRTGKGTAEGGSVTLKLGEVLLQISPLPTDETQLAIPGDDPASSVPDAPPSLATWGEGAVAGFALRQLPQLLEIVAGRPAPEAFAARVVTALGELAPGLSFTIRLRNAIVASGGEASSGTGRDWTRGDWALLVTGTGEAVDRHAPLMNLALRLLVLVDREPEDVAPETTVHASAAVSPPDPPTQSLRLRALYDQASRIARGGISVLIHGETGTGKELFARFLHANADVEQDRLVTLNCAALPADLLEAELFGIEKGVATGVSQRAGRFEQADRGTLFLDEIGDMAMDIQAKILRVLQERKVYRVGSSQARPAQVRVISATNRDLEQMVQDGSFRRDLYHRLADWTVELPALRRRREDIANLTAYFLGADLRRQGKRFGGISEAALAALHAYRWPGNVRELEREMLRCALFLEAGEPLQADHLQDRIRHGDASAAPSLRAQLEAAERKIIDEALEAAGGDVDTAAKQLEIGKSTLYRRIGQLGLGD